MTTATPLANVIPSMQDPLRDFASLLRTVGGDNAKSFTLFGTIAAGSFDESRHTARSVLVLQTIDLIVLRKIAEQGQRFGKKHIAAPLIMTPGYIEASRDTFPLELLDIQQNHVVVFGEDHFANLTFEDSDIRRQCERELKVLAMNLRQGLLAAAGREKMLTEIEQSAGDDLLRILRGMLWLKGRREAQPGARVLSEVENLVNRKLLGVRGALEVAGPHGWSEFEKLYHDIQALGDIVDAW